jgi:large subunit ribosomal protein L25
VSEVKLTAQERTEFGKGAARRLRRAHRVPAVLYGHGTDPVHLSLEGHATMLALKTSNALLDLDLWGRSTLALPKDVQRDPLRGTIEHVDLVIVRRGERVTVDIAVHLTGEPAPGALVAQELHQVSLEVEATAIPTSVSASVEGLRVGSQLHATDLALPDGATLITEPEILVASVTAPAVEEEEPTAEAADEIAVAGEAPAQEASGAEASQD